MSITDQLAEAEKKRDPYAPKYESQMSGLLAQMGKGFNYDFNKDQTYQDYRNNFSQLAATGQANANTDTEALSGGLGTTYGAQASAQAAQQYRTTMNNIIPQLYEAALDKYDAEQRNISTQFGMMGDEENRLYGMYRDQVADDMADRNYYYGKYQDELKNNQWQQQFDYNRERDLAADARWQQQFDYTASRDRVADDRWQKQFNYGAQRDLASDAKWQAQFDYGAQRDLASDAKWQQQFDYTGERDKVKDEQWQKQFDESVRQFDLNYALKQAAAAKGRSGGSGRKGSSAKAGTNDRYEYLNHERNSAVQYALKNGATKEQAIAYGNKKGNDELNRLIQAGDFKDEPIYKIAIAATAARGGKLTR